ncbi:MAG: type II secretion system F family protein [Candidatus Dormiibacterota bacterium]
MNPLVLLLDALGALALGSVVAYGLTVWRSHGVSDELDDRLQRFAEAGSGLPAYAPPTPGDEALGNNPRDRVRRGLQLLRRQVGGGNRTGDGDRQPRNVHTAEALARADLKLRPREWYLIRIGAVVLPGVIGFGINRTPIFALVLAVVGFFVPPIVLKYRSRKRLRKFNDQLGDTLILLSNALKAGYSFPQAMASIARSAPPPMCEEFARATREVQLGVTTDAALQHMVARIDSEDLDLVVTAVQIQRVVGGNLAEIFDNIAFTIRERVRIKGEIRTLTAQARTSSYIITGLPVGLGLILEAINPTYISPLLSFKGPGPYVLIACALSIGFAFYVMQRIANIEV